MAKDYEEAKYVLVMPFFIDTDGYTDRDREMFVCGVEFEMLCQEMRGQGKVVRTIHKENESRAKMAAKTLGRRVNIESCGEGFPEWSYLTSPSLIKEERDAEEAEDDNEAEDGQEGKAEGT